MIRKLKSEEDLLDPIFRKQIIEEITGPENIKRKQSQLKRYEIYRDQIRKYVIESLQRDNLRPETLAQISNRAASISICRKIINKRARVYSNGVVRAAEQAQEQIDELAKLLDMNAHCKKADAYSELFKNTMLQVVPELEYVDTEDNKQYCLRIRNFAPYQYDVIENPKNFEEPKVVILTDFLERDPLLINTFSSSTRTSQTTLQPYAGDKQDQAIADSPEDSGYNKRQYIWWSGKYHFTTNEHGEIIKEKSPEDMLNPIQVLPFVNIAEDQDGQFWAKGGDDLIEGSILINVLATDMNALAFIQGWGQLTITGKNIPKFLEGGPHNALIIEHDQGDPIPSVSYQSANPPLDKWMQMIEQYCALLLSTNDLAPSTVSGKLDASNAPSGIAMLIEQSEVTSSIEEKQQVFKDAERSTWNIIAAWQNLLFDEGALSEEFKEVGKLPEDLEVTLKFPPAKQAVSEAERLANLKLKKDLGIASMVDIIQQDNPDLSEEQAVKKLQDIMAEKMKNLQSSMGQAINQMANPPQAPETVNNQEENAQENLV